MTENSDAFRGKKESKLRMRFNESRRINHILRSKNMNVKKKKEYDSPQYCKKTYIRQKMKQKSVKSRNSAKKLSVSNMILKYNEETYEYQIQQLTLMFKQSLKYPTLTQDELDILSMKYKVDGHYRLNKNLPPFKSLLHNTQGTSIGKTHDCGQMQCTSNCNMQKLRSRNSEIVSSNQNIENSNICEKTVQPNFRHDLPNTEILKLNNVDNKLENKYVYTDETSPANSNYSHICMYHNMQTHGNTNMLHEEQNLTRARSNFNARNNSDLQEEHSSCNLMNAQNIIPEEYQTYRNLFCNAFGSSVRHDNLSNSSEVSQQNVTHSLHGQNDFSLNSNFYTDLNSAKWSNMTPTNKNNDCQSCVNTKSIHIPRIASMESCCSIKNSATPCQLSLMNSHLEEQVDLGSFDHASTHSFMNNKNLPHASHDDVWNIQQDFNAYNANPSGMSENFVLGANTFVPFSATLNDPYN